MATRAYLRKHIGRLTGDVKVLTATSAGTTTTLVDAINLADENNDLVGRLGWFASGTSANLYSTVRVTANTKSSTTLTFTPAVSSSTATNDVLELYNRVGQGPTIDEIHDAITRCIESVSNLGLTEVEGSSSTFDADTPTAAITASWSHISGVRWQDENDIWHEVPPEDLVVNIANRTIEIQNTPRWLANGQSIRLWGYTPSSSLASDTATTTVDAEWIIHQSAADLLLALATAQRVDVSRENALRATAQYHQQRADAMRPKVRRNVRGLFIRLQ